MITHGEWHTVTVLVDGENDDGTPCLHYELEHVDNCAPPTPPDEMPYARCHLEHLIWELAGEYAGEYGIPTAPGTYRMRAWSEPGHWCGPHWEDPDEGIEVEEEQENIAHGTMYGIRPHQPMSAEKAELAKRLASEPLWPDQIREQFLGMDPHAHG